MRDAARAVSFYAAAFGAAEVFRTSSPDGRIVAELAIGEARFRVADEAPEFGNFSPETLQGTAVRISLLVEDPDGLMRQALDEGAVLIAPVVEQPYGLRQGRLADPFGHHWLIGRPLEGELGAWARPSPGPG